LSANNNRPWFEANKSRYEDDVRTPLTQFVIDFAPHLAKISPHFVADPRPSGGSIFRIYRDTRFSEDKSPLKTHVAAMFPCRGLARHEGAGLYFHVALDGVWVGGGMYAPDTSHLQAERDHIATNIKRFRAIVESPRFRRAFGKLEGEQLQRVPRGYPKEHEAADYLRHRQFLAGKEYPARFACSPGFYKGVVGVFREAAPLVRFLNEPLLKRGWSA